MDNEVRKAEIRRRLKLARYPRRPQAIFTDENDHNPLILEDCRTCHGTGLIDILVDTTYVLDDCPNCKGTGTTEELVTYFHNNASAINVKIREDGWVKCPCCNYSFSTADFAVWTGLRHKRCGQKLNIN